MKCKICGKEFYNPYIKSNYCSKECENNSNKEDDTFNMLKNMMGIK